jgi:hypothetical protein
MHFSECITAVKQQISVMKFKPKHQQRFKQTSKLSYIATAKVTVTKTSLTFSFAAAITSTGKLWHALGIGLFWGQRFLLVGQDRY